MDKFLDQRLNSILGLINGSLVLNYETNGQVLNFGIYGIARYAAQYSSTWIDNRIVAHKKGVTLLRSNVLLDEINEQYLKCKTHGEAIEFLESKAFVHSAMFELNYYIPDKTIAREIININTSCYRDELDFRWNYVVPFNGPDYFYAGCLQTSNVISSYVKEICDGDHLVMANDILFSELSDATLCRLKFA